MAGHKADLGLNMEGRPLYGSMRTCITLKPLWAAESILGGCRPGIWTYFQAFRS
jgi:hypothetical protein